MAKILISPLGVGGRFTNEKTSEREYRKTVYEIDGIKYPETYFVASVLNEHLNLDGIIFIGTVKSMWEAVYDYFCQKNGIQKDDEYWLDLACKIDELNHSSSLDSLNLTPIERILGDRSRCLVTKYGLNQEELWENFEITFQAISSLKQGDKVYLDITHSFRSLSLFQFLTLTFINDLLTEKNIEIAGVYYGMLDVSREFGYAPVIDLKSLFEMTSWIKGAHDLQNYGNGYLIAQLLQSQNNSSNNTNLAKNIEILSNAINMNYVNNIKQQSSMLKSLLKQPNDCKPFNTIRGILDNFIKKFTHQEDRLESEFQLDLADWYFKNKRYATGYITIAEAIITYLCEIHDKNFKEKESRQEMQDLLRNKERFSQLGKIYDKINPVRNSIAHASFDKNKLSLDKAITSAESDLQTVRTIFSNRELS
jgi:CRISPR-associated Csx2 family protein